MADLYYYEAGYVDEKYFVYTADAEIAIEPYIEGGYIELGYYVPGGSSTTLTCTAQIVVGQEVIANGAWDSEAAVTCSAGKNVDVVSTMAAEFSQSAAISHIEGADLFALSEAAMAAIAARYRDTQADTDSVFDIATDYIRYRTTSSDADAAFDITADNQRSRNFESTVQAAFSFTASVDDLIKEAASDLSAESSVSFIGGPIVEAEVTNAPIVTFLLAAPYEYAQRTTSQLLSGGARNSFSFDASTYKFGSASLKGTNTSGGAIHPGIVAGLQPVYKGTEVYYINRGFTHKTTDGVTWTSNSNNLPTAATGTVTWDGTYFITASAEYIDTATFYAINKIWYSTDGFSWSSHTVHDGTDPNYRNQFNKIQVAKFGSYYYLAVRYFVNGVRILRSSSLTGTYSVVYTNSSSGYNGDALSWTTAYADASRVAFAWDDVGGTYRAIASTNGTTWTQVNSTTTSRIDYIKYIGSNYYLGQNGKVTTNSGTLTTSYSSGNYGYWTYANSTWYYNSYQGIAAGSSPDTVSEIFKDTYSQYTYIALPYEYDSTTYLPIDEYLYSSSNGITGWNQASMAGVGNLPAVLSYNSTDLQSWKTLEFWFRLTNTQQQTIITISRSDYPNYIYLGSNNAVQVNYYDDAGTFHILTTGVNAISSNTWYHFRLILDDSGTSYLYINGNQVDSETTGAVTGTGTINIFGQNIASSGNNFWIDELLVSDSVITSAVPTKRWENDANTDLLLHFDGSFIDDTRVQVIPSASLGVIATLSGIIGGTFNLYADLGTEANIVAGVSVDRGAELTAFTNASLSVEAINLRGFDIAASSEATANADAVKIIDIDADVAAVIQSTCDNERLRDTDISTEAVASQITAVVRLAGLFADDLTEFVMSTDGNAVRGINEFFQSTTNFVADNVRVRYSDAINVAAEFAQSTDGFVGKVGEADINAEFTQATDADRTRDNVIALTQGSTLTAVGNNLGKIESTVFNAVTMTVTAVKTTEILDFGMAAQITIEGVYDRIRDIEKDLASEFTQETVVAKTVSPTINTQSIATELTVAVKQAAGDVNVEMVSTMSITAVKTTDITSAFANDVAFTAFAVKNVEADSTMDNAVEFTATAITVMTASAAFEAFAFDITVAVKTTGNDIEAAIVSTMTAAVNVQRDAQADINASLTQSADIERIRQLNSDISTAANVGAVAGYLASGEAVISGAMTFVSSVREIHIEEIVYVIPGEIWTYEIQAETRRFAIGSETRTYIIS